LFVFDVKNRVPASSDEDLAMRSKRQNKVFGCDLWIFSCIDIPTKWIYFFVA